MTKILIITDEHTHHKEDKEKECCASECYTSAHGKHFNERLLNYATSRMLTKDTETGKSRQIVPFTQSDVDEILSRQGVKLDKKKGLDYVYVANMAKADFWKSSIDDERHLALYIKDVIDDCDAHDDTVFMRWCACECDVPWEELV